jgi:hypothetical protein
VIGLLRLIQLEQVSAGKTTQGCVGRRRRLSRRFLTVDDGGFLDRLTGCNGGDTHSSTLLRSRPAPAQLKGVFGPALKDRLAFVVGEEVLRDGDAPAARRGGKGRFAADRGA